ncbi:MAG: SBBP repeat-containing protein [Deltaproteobacteria bacterium]|nr:SBBP repeat-containing protein [Deltaproteobacteria bacterium]
MKSKCIACCALILFAATACDRDDPERIITDPATISRNRPPDVPPERTQPPKTTTLLPLREARNVNIETTMAVTFDQDMDEAFLLDPANTIFSVLDPQGNKIEGRLEYQNKTLTFIPARRLAYSINYSARVLRVAKNREGTPLDHDTVWTFTTSAPPIFNGVKQIPSAGNDVPTDIAIDQDGFLYVAGWTEGGLTATLDGSSRPPTATDRDAFLIKFNPTGDKVWGKRIRSDADDTAFAVAVDNTHGIYVTGQTKGVLIQGSPAPAAGGSDIFVMAFDNRGSERWRKQLSSTGVAGVDTACCLALQADGNLLLAGTSNGDFATPVFGGTTFGGGDDVIVARLSAPDGNVIKSIQRGGISSQFDRAAALAIDSSGNFHVVGNLQGLMRADGPYEGSQDVFWLRYSLANFGLSIPTAQHQGLINIRQTGSPAPDTATSAAVDANGNLYIAGATDGGAFPGGTARGGTDQFVVKFNLNHSGNNNIEFITQDGGSGHDKIEDMTIDDQGNPLICGSFSNNIRQDGQVYFGRIAATGGVPTSILNQSQAANGSCKAITVDADGNTYLTGFTAGQGQDLWLMKFNRDGILQ